MPPILINRITILIRYTATAAAKSLQSCPTLCDPIDSSPPGSPVPGILQARTLEWVAIFFSNAWKWRVKVKLLSPVQLFATPWTAAYQAPPSMGFSRQEYWSRVPSPSPFRYNPAAKMMSTTSYANKIKILNWKSLKNSGFHSLLKWSWRQLTSQAKMWIYQDQTNEKRKIK